jgi:hypothetical protein
MQDAEDVPCSIISFAEEIGASSFSIAGALARDVRWSDHDVVSEI